MAGGDDVVVVVDDDDDVVATGHTFVGVCARVLYVFFYTIPCVFSVILVFYIQFFFYNLFSVIFFT